MLFCKCMLRKENEGSKKYSGKFYDTSNNLILKKIIIYDFEKEQFIPH